jgi:hypothetical protein
MSLFAQALDNNPLGRALSHDRLGGGLTCQLGREIPENRSWRVSGEKVDDQNVFHLVLAFVSKHSETWMCCQEAINADSDRP